MCSRRARSLSCSAVIPGVSSMIMRASCNCMTAVLIFDQAMSSASSGSRMNRLLIPVSAQAARL